MQHKQQQCAISPAVPSCPMFQSSEMMSGALPPLLVITPASARLEELTCVLLAWWLVDVMMLPGVLLVRVEVRLSKNIGGQYCLKQTTKNEETNCTREMYALKIHLPYDKHKTSLPHAQQELQVCEQASRDSSREPFSLTLPFVLFCPQ